MGVGTTEQSSPLPPPAGGGNCWSWMAGGPRLPTGRDSHGVLPQRWGIILATSVAVATSASTLSVTTPGGKKEKGMRTAARVKDLSLYVKLL